MELSDNLGMVEFSLAAPHKLCNERGAGFWIKEGMKKSVHDVQQLYQGSPVLYQCAGALSHLCGNNFPPGHNIAPTCLPFDTRAITQQYQLNHSVQLPCSGSTYNIN
ncbi:hypothetical protein DUNSADRAFT_16102 [Dunaliella salina]|uniref:Encoded protein n=1 Tax=Dunaliella salina TaxID=3046 RepID=A0ABQ7G472_DUNSA|nr:hypothetical protein DUNSADRAFT_16102 [Dunaliella salina]|eukprot:KAF5829403.1 hypothetical protein DUNSADRAFT_16102 [Dunaliella salina]